MNIFREIENKCSLFESLSNGEKVAVRNCLEEAEIYGYGNLMAWLLTAWNLNLLPQMPNLKKGELPIPERGVTPYPIDR